MFLVSAEVERDLSTPGGVGKALPSLVAISEIEYGPDYGSLVIAPLWKFYEVAKHALAEMEALSLDDRRIDRAYVENRKQHLRAEITEFEQRFPNHRRSDDDQQEHV